MYEIQGKELDINYELPDGQVITVATERFKAPERMFHTQLIGLEEESVHEIVYGSIMKCDRDIRKDLFDNIVLAGGNTMFDGYAQRLQKEVKGRAPGSFTVKICSSEGKYSDWIGGSILVNLSAFEEMWETKEQYYEGTKQ